MSLGLREKLTYANVTSTLALALALGAGTAFAAGQLGPKSVGAPQLRPGAVTADKIRKNAVTAPKIEAAAIKQGKIAGDAIVAAKLAPGAVTAEKIQGGAVTPDKIPAASLTGEKIVESSLGRVPTANSANFADAAGSANPEAFARIDAEGSVFPASSKGIATADVKQGPLPGIYCVVVPGFAPRGAQATPEYTTNNNVDVFVKLNGSEACPAPQVEVRTFNAGNPQKAPFFLAFYR
jgi:hypothetical protein